MIRYERTNSKSKDFIELVKLLDRDLAISDGEDHGFYNQYNGIDTLKYVIVAYNDDIPVACGAIKQYNVSSMEIKRMYTLPIARGKRIATTVLSELENWAKDLGNEKCILETGKKQPQAIALYNNTGYIIIPNYAQYAGTENSVCFEKLLT